jgi:hypothetical protein
MRDSEGGTPGSVKRTHLRVMTLNLLSPDHAGWNRRRRAIQAGIARLRPDLIALQETVKGAGYDQVPDVRGRFGRLGPFLDQGEDSGLCLGRDLAVDQAFQLRAGALDVFR